MWPNHSADIVFLQLTSQKSVNALTTPFPVTSARSTWGLLENEFAQLVAQILSADEQFSVDTIIDDEK